jgi:hypothetical protein
MAHAEAVFAGAPARAPDASAPPRAVLPPWATPLAALACAALFAVVVNAVHRGFGGAWADVPGYLRALFEPLLLSLPAWIVVRVALGWGSWAGELAAVGRTLRVAAFSMAAFAPVVWFCLVTAPTPTFPLFAYGLGAVALWLPLAWGLCRRELAPPERAVAFAWVAVMIFAEARAMLAWLAQALSV